MINHNHRTLLVLALAATFIGAAVAQTTSDEKSRMPADKGMPEAQQTQPADQPTDKMKGQTDAQAPASDQAGKKTATEKSAKPAKQASKAHSQPTAAAEPPHELHGLVGAPCFSQDLHVRLGGEEQPQARPDHVEWFDQDHSERLSRFGQQGPHSHSGKRGAT